MSDELDYTDFESEDQSTGESLRDQIEREAQLFAEAEEIPVAAKVETAQKTSLGKAEKFQTYSNDEPLAADLGWKPVPLENLPSLGLFYEEGTQVAIRSATVAEIRHWSTIDENDLLGVDDMLNFIIEKCCRIKIPGKPGNFKDLKEIDRFYLIFAIRDYTFKSGENKMMVNVVDDNGITHPVEVTKESIDYFNTEDRLMNWYDPVNKCFQLNMKSGESFKIHMPTLGVMTFIKNFIKGKQQAGQNFDKAFIKYAPFLFADWKTVNQSTYDKAVQESYTWSVQKISVLDKVVEMLSASVNPQVKYELPGGQEGAAPLNFQGGIKSLFLISDIFDELV
jgi:hypothetical protein